MRNSIILRPLGVPSGSVGRRSGPLCQFPCSSILYSAPPDQAIRIRRNVGYCGMDGGRGANSETRKSGFEVGYRTVGVLRGSAMYRSVPRRPVLPLVPLSMAPWGPPGSASFPFPRFPCPSILYYAQQPIIGVSKPPKRWLSGIGGRNDNARGGLVVVGGAKAPKPKKKVDLRNTPPRPLLLIRDAPPVSVGAREVQRRPISPAILAHRSYIPSTEKYSSLRSRRNVGYRGGRANERREIGKREQLAALVANTLTPHEPTGSWAIGTTGRRGTWRNSAEPDGAPAGGYYLMKSTFVFFALSPLSFPPTHHHHPRPQYQTFRLLRNVGYLGI